MFRTNAQIHNRMARCVTGRPALHHHAIQSSFAMGWAVVRGLALWLCIRPIDPGRLGGVQAVRLCNGLVDPGRLYIGLLSRIARSPPGCITGKVILLLRATGVNKCTKFSIQHHYDAT